MLRIQIMQIGVACLYLVLNTVSASRTSPAHLQAKAATSFKQLTVSRDDPNRHAPLWADSKAEDVPVKVTKGKGSNTGVEPIDDVSKEVPEGTALDNVHHVGKALDTIRNPEDAGKEVTMPRITGAFILQSLISLFMSMICLLICAFGYTRVKTDMRVPPNDGDDHSPNALNRGTWRFGLFDCIHDSKICLISCCCPCIRWSDTMRMAGLMTFWTAIIVMGVLGALSAPTGGLALLVMLCLATYRRQQIRQLFGMQSMNSGNHTSMFEDCCVYIWCSCCAIVQEARQLEEAYAVGYPLQIKAPMMPPQTLSSQRLAPPQQLLPSQQMLPSQPLQSQRMEYMQPMPSQRIEYQAPQALPQPSWGQVPQQQQPMIQQQPQPMMQQRPQPTVMQPTYSQQSLPPVSQTVMRPTQSMQSLPPQSMQSLPPAQYAQPQFVSGPPVMGTPTNQQPLQYTPPGSMQSLPPTNYQQ